MKYLLFGYGLIFCIIIGYFVERHDFHMSAIFFVGALFSYLSMIVDALNRANE